MKTRICLGLLIVAALFPQAARAEDSCTKIVATGHPDYPVMAFRDGDRIKGAAPLLVAQIADGLDVPFEAKYTGSWSDAQAATRAGETDMIIGVYYNEERDDYLEFVKPPFAYDPVQVFVANDARFDFQGQQDLVGKKGVANKGESFGTTFDAFLADQLTVARADGLSAAFDTLLSGDADYVIAGFYPGTAELARLGLDDQITPLEPELVSEELFVAFSKTSPCAALAEKFGAGIAEMTEDGSFRGLVRDALRDWEGRGDEE